MSFARTESACKLHRRKHVTGSVNSFDQRLAVIRLVLELRTQAMDVNIERIFLYIGCMPPARFNQLFASRNQTLMSDKSFEQLKLLSGEGNLLTISDNHTATPIESDASYSGEW